MLARSASKLWSMRVRYDWAEVQRFYDEGHGRDECAAHFGFSLIAWYKAIARGKLRAQLQRQKLSTGLPFSGITMKGIPTGNAGSASYSHRSLGQKRFDAVR